MVLESLAAVVAIIIVGILISKKVNATIALFIGGVLLLMVAPLLGHTSMGKYKVADAGNVFLNQFGYITAIFAETTSGVGLIIMVLFGFSVYMTHIGANTKVIQLLSRPLLRMKRKYLLVPLMFWVGNIMSLAVPSASSLAVLLMATFFPALVGAGLTPLTVAGVIATTATIMPTPLAANNVVAADRLGIPLDEYVFSLHASVSIPTLFVIGIVHYFWQKYLDGKLDDATPAAASIVTAEESAEATHDDLPMWYAIFPLLPLLLILIPFALSYVMTIGFKMDIIPVTLISILLTLLAEAIRTRSITAPLSDLTAFFNGMGRGFSVVVALAIAANVLVEGIVQLGIIDSLSHSISQLDGAAWILFLAFSGIMILLTVLTGGIGPFYSLVEVAPQVAAHVGINGALLTLPLQLTGCLARSCSPVAAVILIVCSSVKESPTRLIARTIVPMAVGIVVSMALTWIIVGP
ncbi:C4-dicarboxylate transporter DcuC [Trueperella sp. LYQ143]|uniref:C4-dicarboxylate transporter DcuC n=1 Tax=unclassified Trueperella TaxID=2630174 RepID=UPI0039838FBB